MNQEGLSLKVGLSRTSVTNIELGRQSVLVHQLVAFAQALGVSVEDLIPSQKRLQPELNQEEVSEEVASLLGKLYIPAHER